MDTSKLKSFAQNARRIIKDGVRLELQKKGFDVEGNVLFRPTQITNGTLFDGKLYGAHFYDQWMQLHERIMAKGLDMVYEEAAYTWFNRLIALQILSKNNIINIPVLEFADPVRRVPYIVEEARNGRWTGIDDYSKARVQPIINEYDKIQEQFAILVSSFCRNTPIINQCFGGIADYTEILLPSNILAADNFICMLNDKKENYISDEDYRTTELLGWLYQFYISEKKKAVNEQTEWSADDVPAGTQIFTPNWIVKYMVENTLGRIYLDHDKYASFKDEMKYLVEPSNGEHPIFEFEKLEDLKCADFSCGSGHILNEFFDLLMKCYIEEGNDPVTAIGKIFTHNLVGIDLDTRAQQLTMFSLLLKACQQEKEAFKDAHIMPHVLDMPAVVYNNICGIINSLFSTFNANVRQEVDAAFQLVEKANELGSIMKFNLCDESREAMTAVAAEYNEQENADSEIVKAMDLMLILTDKYSAIAMNPPYMGRKHMDSALSSYTNLQYSKTKADLFSVFMDVAEDRLAPKAKYGMINMQSWMFLPTFIEKREEFLDNNIIDSLIHLGTNTFDELSGEVVNSTTFVCTKESHAEYNVEGVYFKLTEEGSCSLKESAFLNESNCFYANQDTFKNVLGCPICYWLSKRLRDIFDAKDFMSKYGRAYQGLATADNDRFTRIWHEVSVNCIGFNLGSTEEACASGLKWFPYNNGGKGRRWYGNQQDIVNWYNDGEEIKNFRDENGRQKSRPQNTTQYFKEVISWNMITLSGLYFRYFPQGFIFSNASNSFPCTDIHGTLGFLNSKFTPKLLELLSPGTNMSNGVLAKFPNMVVTQNDCKQLVKKNISISKQDWDAHETSWDFNENELVRIFKANGCGDSLEETLNAFIAEWTAKFFELHRNEEDLNDQFINIYGLQNELTKVVPLNEVTILQQKEKDIENGQLKWNKDVIIKQLVSYAIGCMMGRYRLDRTGLNVAHPNPSAEETANYVVNGDIFSIDDDGIIPLLTRDCPFNDNAVNRVEDFIRLVFGEQNYKDNINFVNAQLGSIEDYLTKNTKGFWADHTQMYQKTPIYWLFSSKKGAFKCLVYMHRMTQFTARDVRDKYLLKYIDFLRNMIAPLEAQEATLGREDKKKLAGYKKALEECVEYDKELHSVAQQFIQFDLDDGVKVNYAKFGNVLAKI